MAGFLKELQEICGPENVLEAPFDVEPYLKDWRETEYGNALCVVLPKNTDEVSRIVVAAGAAQCPIFLQGGNTGLSYGAVPSKSGEGIVLALGRMKSIRSIDRASNCITVDAGVVLDSVHRAAEEIGRNFPLHLGSEGTAQIGGLIATNAGGTNALRYGTMRDLVYGLEVVLPDGRILSDLNPLRKNNIGYDLRHLQIGAEGTLGVVTAASLKLHPALRSDAHAWLSFNDPEDAVSLLGQLQDRFDTSIIAYELLSQKQVELVLKHIPRTRIPLSDAPDWSVLVELGTSNQNIDLTRDLEEFLADQFENSGLQDAVVAQNKSQASDFWHVRHSVSEANKIEGRGLTHDVAVSISRVPDFLEASTDILARNFPRSYPVVTCHLGDGNIHFIAMFSADVWKDYPDKQKTIDAVQTEIHDLACRLGGTFSAEHGIGRKLKGELQRLVDPAKYRILCRLKAALDPQNILNPGILFDEDFNRQNQLGLPASMGGHRDP